MDLRGFRRGAQVVDRDLIATAVRLERVAQFVHQRLDVGAASVEVGEHEGYAVRREHRAVRAERLSRPKIDVQQAPFLHDRRELAEGGRDRGQRVDRAIDDPRAISQRCDMLCESEDFLVPKIDALEAGLRAEAAHEILHDRDHRRHDVVAISRDVGRTVVDSAHATIAERDEVFVAQRPRHAVAQTHEFVEDRIELLRDGIENAPAGHFGGSPRCPVRVPRESPEPRQGAPFAFELGRRRGQHLGVLAGQFGFADELLRDPHVERANVRIPQREGLRAEFGFERSAQRAAVQETAL